jgi:hypothetical protein
MKRAALVAIVLTSLGACGDQEWSFDDAAADAPGDAAADAPVDAPVDASGEASRDAPADTPGDTSGETAPDVSNGGCSTDADCIIATLHCDTASGQCVECVSTEQCPNGEKCDTMLERCIDCYVDSDCPKGRACQPTTYECVPSCMSDTDCPQYLPYCSQHGVCVGCLSNQNCSTMTGTMQIMGTCDPNIGQCAECLSNLQCASVCDRTTDRCVGCLTGFDCPHNEVCDPYRHECDGPDASFATSGDATDEFAPR